MLLLMGFLLCWFFSLVLCVVFIGFITVFESSLLGLLQLSMGVVSSGFSFYQFFMDFLKVVFKSFYKGYLFGIFFSYVFILFIILVISMVCLPFFSFGLMMPNVLLFMIFLDSVSLLVKFSMFFFCYSKFFKLSFYSIYVCYMVIEAFYLFCLLIFVFWFIFLGCMSFNSLFFCLFEFGFCYCFFIMPIWMLFLFCILLKSFSIPFDYVESESELVGGFSLEMFGLMFSIWSLVEYGNVFFMVFFSMFLFFGNIYKFSFVLFVFMFIIFLIFMLSFSGVLISFSLSVLMNLFFSVYMMLFLLILLSFLLCFCFLVFLGL